MILHCAAAAGRDTSWPRLAGPYCNYDIIGRPRWWACPSGGAERKRPAAPSVCRAAQRRRRRRSAEEERTAPYCALCHMPNGAHVLNAPAFPMTWTSTMSSGYSSLEEDSEDFFFTARTSFFKKPQGKPADCRDVEKEKGQRTHLSREEICRRIDFYNSCVRDHLKMTLSHNGLYTGFIKVQLELRRPITVRQKVGSGCRAGGEAFYLPQGAVNTLHISSTNTVRQVIEALLRKFTVADNPAKFALFKRCRREEQVYVCKLAEDEHPLFLRLLAGPNMDTLSFVLREQQPGEVIWDAFTIPELQNFLRILDKEEQEQLEVLRKRYTYYKQGLEGALRAAGQPG